MSSRLPLRSFAPAVLLLALAPLRAQDPVFHDADPGRLQVKVLGVEGALKGHPSSLVTLEVSNPTELWAEPSEFALVGKGRARSSSPLRIARVMPPFHGRLGRAVAPKGKLTYVVNAPLDPGDVSKSGAEVLHASFFDGAPPFQDGDPPVEVGEIDEAEPEVTFQGDRLRFSRIELRNTTEHVVDAILLARFDGPKAGEALVHCRLEPSQRRTWTVEGAGFRAPGNPDLRGSEIRSAELVDWSVLRSSPDERARALLQAAYEARASWPSPKLRYAGRYAFEIEEWDYAENERVKRKETGRFRSEGGFPDFTPDGGGEAIAAGWILLGRANRMLAREPFDEWLGTAAARLHTLDGDDAVVAVLKPTRDGSFDRYYWIADGAIVGEAGSPLPSSSPSSWFELKTSKAGALVAEEVERQIQDPEPRYPTIYRYEYELVDGVPIPATLHHERHVNPDEQSSFAKLVLSDVRIESAGGEAGGGSVAGDVPTGPLADEVRAAWERGYRYPDDPVDLSGRFVVTNPGNDALWQGHRKVEGAFTLKGFEGERWASWEIELDGKYTEDVAQQLESVVEDRLRMYSGRRDHCGRASFDEVFAGATFEERGGKLFVHGGKLERLEIKKGRIEAYWASGQRYELKWSKRGDDEIVTRFEAGKESITYDREELDGWWIPVDVKMKDVFEDWGPERVKLSDLRIAKPGS